MSGEIPSSQSDAEIQGLFDRVKDVARIALVQARWNSIEAELVMQIVERDPNKPPEASARIPSDELRQWQDRRLERARYHWEHSRSWIVEWKKIAADLETLHNDLNDAAKWCAFFGNLARLLDYLKRGAETEKYRARQQQIPLEDRLAHDWIGGLHFFQFCATWRHLEEIQRLLGEALAIYITSGGIKDDAARKALTEIQASFTGEVR